MGRWVFGALGFVAAASACAACSGGTATVSPTEARCRRLCEAAKACPNADPQAASFNCYLSCDDLEALNRSNECYDEANSYYACIEKHGVCSDIAVECLDQEDVYSDCLPDPCSTDPDRDICS